MINKNIKYIPYILIPLLAAYLISRGNLYEGNLSINTNNLTSYFLLNTLSLLMGITYFKTIKKYLNLKISIINLLVLILSTAIPYNTNIYIDELHVILGYIMVFTIGSILLIISYKFLIFHPEKGRLLFNILIFGYIACAGMFISFNHVNSIIEIFYIFLINTIYYQIAKIC